MRRVVAAIAVMLLTIGVSQAQMTNEAITEYIKSATLMGKTDQQIGEELIARGVSIDQLRQVKAQLSNRSANAATNTNTVQNGDDKRGSGDEVSPVGQPDGAMETDDQPKPTQTIFGHDLFHSQNMTFEPNENAATPANYRLGPGDELVVDIWGASETNFRQKVTPEGIIQVPQVGAVLVGGSTLQQATEKIRRAAARRYAGLANGGSQLSVTLGRIRTINVQIMGEVTVPGTYRLSSFSTIFSALYRAGGINDGGSLRNVQLIRDGETIDTIDVYQYLFYGSTVGDVNLMDGDVIIVPTYENLVTVDGRVKRPMQYELRKNETLGDALRYAGGFTGNAYRARLKVVRQTNRERQIYTVNETEFDRFTMADGDLVTIDSNLNRYENMVLIEGAVYRPGEYELGGEVATVRQLVNHADGLMPDAFLGRAVLIREQEDLSLMTIAVDLGKVMSGEASDVLLHKNDMIVISKVSELQDNGTMSIVGWVNQPGTFPYADNTTIEDMVVRAGGFKRGAATVRADVARRIYDPTSRQAGNQLAQVFTMDFSEGLGIVEGEHFTLEPYDIVIVRRSPDYTEQQKVTISGEVTFPGEYILSSTEDHLSDLLKRAGGTTQFAYVRGSKIMRRNFISDQEEMIQVLENLSSGVKFDSLTMQQARSQTYPVGVQLEEALKHPHSDYDIILQDGDEIIVPRYDGTVRINGEVMRPNAVAYNKGKNAKYYINQAGGYGLRAQKRQTYIVYPNGTVSRARRWTRVEPGCEIIVPQKPERTKMTTSEVLALSSAAVSMVSVVIALINVLSK